MRKYKYVKGIEIRTYQDIIDSYHGFIIEDDVSQSTHDRSLLLSKNEEVSLEKLNDILEQGAKVYSRVKEYREPIFSIEIDEELETILTDFAYDYHDSDFGNESLIDQTLKKLKDLQDGKTRKA